MNRHPDFVIPYPPSLISPLDLAGGELAALESAESNLLLIHSGADSLISAVELFQFARANGLNNGVIRQWGFIAARDGAMSLNNVAMGMRYCRKVVGSINGLRDLIDHDTLKEAEKHFRTNLPNIEKLRHSVAHQEYYSNPDKKTDLDQQSSISSLNLAPRSEIANSIVGDRFVATWDGELIGYSLSIETVRIVHQSALRFFSGFSRLYAASR